MKEKIDVGLFRGEQWKCFKLTHKLYQSLTSIFYLLTAKLPWNIMRWRQENETWGIQTGDNLDPRLIPLSSDF